MITEKRYKELSQGYEAFSVAVSDYKEYMKGLGLPLTIDVAEATLAFKTGLFAKLLAGDKSLQLRMGMLQCEEAKRKLVEDTINLAGYPIVEELPAKVETLRTTFALGNNKIGTRDAITRTTLEVLMTSYQLDITTWLKEHVIVWDSEGERKLVMTQQLAEMVKRVAAEIDSDIKVLGFVFQNGEVNELAVWHSLNKRK